MSSWVCGGSPGFRPDLFVQAAVWMRRAVSSSWNQGENCRLSLIKKEINKRSWVTRVARSVRSTSMDTLTVIYLKTRWSLPSKHCFTHDSRRLKPNVSCFFPPQQVVELISSAIGDVVQGLYYENCNNSEVKHQLIFYCSTLVKKCQLIWLQV